MRLFAPVAPLLEMEAPTFTFIDTLFVSNPRPVVFWMVPPVTVKAPEPDTPSSRIPSPLPFLLTVSKLIPVEV